ncbi:MAG: HAD family hydrolase [Anaerolineales bacterium]|nr:HAD family hydrolase [Anaerolineales bacterium]
MQIIYLPATIRTLVFDIDLTLYDSRPYYDNQHELLITRLAEHLNVTVAEAETAVTQIRTDYAQQHGGRSLSLGNAFVQLGVPIAINAQWRAALFQPEAYLLRDEKLIATMKRLSNKYLIAAVTNNATIIGVRTLNALGVADYFAPVIGLDISDVSKPDIRPFQMVCTAHGIALSEAVSIGDRMAVDIELPLQHGMGGILVESLADIYRLPAILL